MTEQKLTTGSKNLDLILGGGVPQNTITIMGGSSGIGKSILANQMLFANLKEGGKGVYCTTTSESVNRMLRRMQLFTFFDEEKINSSLSYEDTGELLVKEGLTKFIDLVAYQLQHTHIDYFVIDGFEAFLAIAQTISAYQKFVYELLGLLGAYLCSTILIGTYSLKEFQESCEMCGVDQALWLERDQTRPPYHRTILAYKWSNTLSVSGKHTFAIGEQGIRVFPQFTVGKPARKTENLRTIQWGDPLLDRLSGGGILIGSASMLYGDAGTGKTLAGLRFIKKKLASGENGAIVSFQEDQVDLTACASFMGWDLKESITKKEVNVLYLYPVNVDLDELALKIIQVVREVNAKRIFINDISYVGKFLGNRERFLEFLYTMQKFMKNTGVTLVWTYPAVEYTEEQFLVSMMDNVVLFRFQRTGRDKASRWVEIMKIRGKTFDAGARSFEITADGFLEGETMAGAPSPLKK